MKLAVTQIALGALIIVIGIVLGTGYHPGVIQELEVLAYHDYPYRDYDITFTIPFSGISVFTENGLPVIESLVEVTFPDGITLPSIGSAVDIQIEKAYDIIAVKDNSDLPADAIIGDILIEEASNTLYYVCLGTSFVLGIAVLGCGIVQLRRAKHKAFLTIDY